MYLPPELEYGATLIEPGGLSHIFSELVPATVNGVGQSLKISIFASVSGNKRQPIVTARALMHTSTVARRRTLDKNILVMVKECKPQKCVETKVHNENA